MKETTRSTEAETRSFETRWVLKYWIVVLTCAMAKNEKDEVIVGINDVKAGRKTTYEFTKPCWLFGQLSNRPGFKDNVSVITSRINRIEIIDSTIYGITESDSCYRLADAIDGIGVRYGDKDIEVEYTTPDGETARYLL